MKAQQPPRTTTAIRAPLIGTVLPWGEILIGLAVLAVLVIGA